MSQSRRGTLGSNLATLWEYLYVFIMKMEGIERKVQTAMRRVNRDVTLSKKDKRLRTEGIKLSVEVSRRMWIYIRTCTHLTCTNSTCTHLTCTNSSCTHLTCTNRRTKSVYVAWYLIGTPTIGKEPLCELYYKKTTTLSYTYIQNINSLT